MDIELGDVIVRDNTEYPAYVFSTSSAGDAMDYTAPGGQPLFVGFSMAETLRAIVEPGNSWLVNDQVTWSGRSYYVSYVANRRDIDGTDHHVTLTLQTAP